nr:formin-like protein 1 [Tanacetum cinerariifolium]
VLSNYVLTVVRYNDCACKMAPTKEKGRKLREHIDDTSVKLGHAEKFLNEVLDVPFDKYPDRFKHLRNGAHVLKSWFKTTKCQKYYLIGLRPNLVSYFWWCVWSRRYGTET